jgi:hypothetical protein
MGASTWGDVMSYDACRNHSHGYELPSIRTRVPDGIHEGVREYQYRFGDISVLAPPQLESASRRVMDRLLRECLERKLLME